MGNIIKELSRYSEDVFILLAAGSIVNVSFKVTSLNLSVDSW